MPGHLQEAHLYFRQKAGVCMNTIITSFLLRCSCDDVKLLLIDPKKVEFTPYHKIPHLLGPVISDPTKANNALKIVVNIMD